MFFLPHISRGITYLSSRLLALNEMENAGERSGGCACAMEDDRSTVHEINRRRKEPGLLFAKGSREGSSDVFSKRTGRRVAVLLHGGSSRIL